MAPLHHLPRRLLLSLPSLLRVDKTPHLRAQLLALFLIVHRLLDLLRVGDKVLDDLLSVGLAVLSVPTLVDVELVSVHLRLLGAS